MFKFQNLITSINIKFILSIKLFLRTRKSFLPLRLPRKQPPPLWVHLRRPRVPVFCKFLPREDRLHSDRPLERPSLSRHRRGECPPSIIPLCEPTAVHGLYELDPKGHPDRESERCST